MSVDSVMKKIKCNDNVSNINGHQDITSHIRPSEALFVRCLLPHCKRLAPLWFKGVSSMREKNREEHRRILSSSTTQNQNDWESISDFIYNLKEATETETSVNLLKKLYKELLSDTIMWFIKCWLKFPETMENEEKCAFSRGDVRGRMKRIDGGKGSDKVWRLDTIVGMMFHGMPMSSTDTNIMSHTCNQELCIRPQHLRFRASSVALVAVLKALQQTGYLIIPPSDGDPMNGDTSSPEDEFVDVSGPFKIEQLQKYRQEDLKPFEQSMGKLNCSSSDYKLLETYPILKNYYPTYIDNMDKTMLDYKLKSTCINTLKRPAQTMSNSTGSPPQINDGNIHQCHSPPNLSSFKSVNTEIAPTPRKVETFNSQNVFSFKKQDDSPSSSIFSKNKEKENFIQVQNFLTKESSEINISSVRVMNNICSVTKDSPNLAVSYNISGKNTPRQPAKKRLEARSPTFFLDNEPDVLSPVNSPSNNKLNSNISAFRSVPKKNFICDELTEVEVAKIFDPCNTFQNDSYLHEDPFLSKTCDLNTKCLSNIFSNSDFSNNMSQKVNETLTTPSPLDYLFMAIGHNSSDSVDDDRNNIHDTKSFSSIADEFKVNDYNTSSQIPSKSSLCCGFTPEQASTLFSVLRNSPYGNNNPELIDMLYNMMQQYPSNRDGPNNDHFYRSDSKLLRRQIYQQLSKNDS